MEDRWIKTILNLVFGGIFLLIPLTLSGQRDINGRITDATDGQPIPAVTVFFSNTSVATTTDVDGNYRLQIPGEGSYRLTVSHVGYQPVIKDIEPGNQSITFDTALQPRELDELTVTEKVRTRSRDVSLFWNTLLGQSPSKRTLYAVNPEAAYFFYNTETGILTVTCREPLIIINNETGYQIQVLLDHFRHDYNTELTSWKFEHRFTELTPNNDRQQKSWDKNRKDVYRVSMINFIRSLYNNTLMENGYVLTYPKRTDARGYTRNSNENADRYIREDAKSGCKTFYIPANTKDLLLVCFGEPVSQTMLGNIKALQDAGELNLEKIGVSHTIQDRNRPNQWPNTGLYRNVIETPSGPVCIFADGTVSQPIKLSPYSSNSLAGLNLMLPLDYNPEGRQSPIRPESERAVAGEVSASGMDSLPIPDEDAVILSFKEQLEHYPQEKIHLHTDRDVYVPGEKIWFKAYPTDARTHQYPTPSRYVYVELISPKDSLINRVMIHPQDSMFFGYLPLTDMIPAGNYTLRAYTKFMENQGDDYFFKKNIRIENLGSSQFSVVSSQLENGGKGNEPEKVKMTNASVSSAQNDFDISFFPEGGNLPDGVISRVAFKALNRDGSPAHVSGRLIGEDGTEIASVETGYAGMGVFGYAPQVGKRYFLKCRNVNGLEKQFELPRADSRTYALTAVQNNGKISVGIRTSPLQSGEPLYLLAHCRGDILYFDEWDKTSDVVLFEQEEMPAGIIQIMLFDAQMNPLSERLVFNKNDEYTDKVDFRTDKPVYGKREKVSVSLGFPNRDTSGSATGAQTPSLSERVGVRCSISITDDSDSAVDSSTTILSTLLLSSELKGYIANPAWYLHDTDESAYALDLLMMTHGWRRYNIPEVVKGNPESPQIPFETSRSITGRVKSMTFSKNVKDTGISILLPDGDVGMVSTDENGFFRVDGFEYPDSSVFFINALNSSGSNRFELTVDSVSFPRPIHVSYVETLRATPPQTNDFLEKAEVRSKYDEDMRMIQLGEIEVQAQRIERQDEERLRYWMNSNSKVNIDSRLTFRQEDIARYKPRLVADLLRRIPGVEVKPSGLIRIDQGVLAPPLVYIDGMPEEWPEDWYNEAKIIIDPPVERVNINDVESIDVMRRAGASIFGMRGSGGIISITTKKGGPNRQIESYNRVIYTPLGYQNPAEFYAPKYETSAEKQSPIPDYRTTIFWKPDVVIAEDQEEATFEFYTSDFPTTYSVVIEGLTADGKIIRQVEKISVK
ncbi:MAG: carboxypeptidase-like regulatory domain-containing protein [Tannerella sp.]|jgi:hypothetical protein|nr:carboxypeptidase-like regulatory domain-containing protein [Tannerella sp.]